VRGVLGGGESDAPPPAPPPPPPRPAAAKTPEATPSSTAEKPPVYEYAYSPVGKRDPFRSVLDDLKQVPEESAQVQANCGPLCKWELEQLKLVAVVSGLSNPLGMVEDPQGKGHVVRRGTYIGKHNGKVTQIRSGEIVVSEVFKDHLGKPHVNARVMKLPVENSTKDEEEPNLLLTESGE
ncbi:MAG: pilus assembly protein PilP, partial [Myxococcales bacterium]